MSWTVIGVMILECEQSITESDRVYSIRRIKFSTISRMVALEPA